MQFLDWSTRKKLFYFLIVFLFVSGSVFSFVYFSLPDATCSDGKKNGEEKGIDCGGSCVPCVENPKAIVVFWTKVFKHGNKEGAYEVASLVKNPNVFYGLPFLRYIFKVYDGNNILIAIKEGETFVNPQDEFVVYETNIETGKREAKKAVMEIDPVFNWQYVGEKKLPIVISEKSFSNSPFPSLSARLNNQSISPMEDVSAVAVLYDRESNVVAVSSTKIDFIPREDSQMISFTWPDSFLEEPFSQNIFIRINSFLGD